MCALYMYVRKAKHRFHLSRVHIRPQLWSNYNRIKYEMGSHQLITVPDYNWITITSNNPLGVVWSNYSAWLNKMADTWWFVSSVVAVSDSIFFFF